jgi:murein DD-endopeptidase MepM/ murein hydrolase activator NlpD
LWGLVLADPPARCTSPRCQPSPALTRRLTRQSQTGSKPLNTSAQLLDRLAPQQLQALAKRYRYGIVASAVVLMTGFAITAVAVAPFVPDAGKLPQRLVSEPVLTEDINIQLKALAAQELTLLRSDVTRSTDSAETLLARLGVRDSQAAAFLRSDTLARLVLAGRGGKMVQAHALEDGALLSLAVRMPADGPELAKTHFRRIDINRVDGRLQSRERVLPYGKQTRMASGTIRSTLFAATDEAGLPDAVAAQVADIFSTDIDFHRQLRKGDTFSVVYDALTADGEPVAWGDGMGRVRAAEFINGGKAHHALWFEPAAQQPGASTAKGGYFGVDGRSKRKAFLASPMEFSRVTSGFAMRFHPILKSWRQHLGVDYAAPTGTPVRSVGEGVVEFSGVQNGYGNVVEIKHGNERSTLYAHLSRIDVKKGQRIEQGQLVGAVGSTGWSTGPHLHFEFRVKGQHQDPLLVAKASENTVLDVAARDRFAIAARALQAQLDVAETLGSQRARVE